MTTRTAKKKTPAKRAPVKKAKVPMTVNDTVAGIMRELLPKLDSDMFDNMCEDGQAKILELSRLLNVDHSAFAAPREVQLCFDCVDMELPASFRDMVLVGQFEATVSIKHLPSGTTLETDLYVNDVYVN